MKNNTYNNRHSLLASALSIALATAAGGALAAAGAHDPQADQQHADTQHAGDRADRYGDQQQERDMGARAGESGTSGEMGQRSTRPATGMQAGAGTTRHIDDEVTRERVQRVLQRTSGVTADNIRIQARGGVVELSGTLESQDQVNRAVQAVRDVQGVREVRTADLRTHSREYQAERVDREETNPAMLAKREYRDEQREEASERPLSDTWITTKVKTKLLADTEIAGRRIDVNTVNGVVTLSGYVGDRENLGRIVGTVRATEGVRDVRSSELRVQTASTAGRAGREMEEGRAEGRAQADDRGDRDMQRNTTRGSERGMERGMARDRDAGGEGPDATAARRDDTSPLSDAWITTKVKSSLLANPDIAGLNVDVETMDGVVRLSGTVSSQEQVDRAVAAARSIEGVREVDATDLQQITAAN